MKTQHHRYFTTPIFYANGKPHAGHLYTTLLSGILKRHYQSRGFDTKILTGMDEHGESVQNKAQEKGLPPQELVDQLSERWIGTFQKFEIPYDIFMRTTDKKHVANVQRILTLCHEKGDIYFGEHEGSYCIKCEEFLTSTGMDDAGNCLIHKRPVEKRQEGNYFFRTTKYKEQVETLISSGQITGQERYKNELLSLLKNIEGDLSISRPKSRLNWGVELPFDDQHVTYVWFDALPNYVTGIGGVDAASDDPYWQNAVHIIGKDILKFHGIFWPAMCLSLDIPVPKLLVHGWILKEGHKMSKSLGNVFTPEEILNYGTDMFANYVYRIAHFGDDIDFSWESYFDRYNADLANGIGNLVSRTLTMVQKYLDGKIPNILSSEDDLSSFLIACVNDFQKAFDEGRLEKSFDVLDRILKQADGEITAGKPWALFKNADEVSLQILRRLLAKSLIYIKTYSYLAYAFFPNKMQEVLESMGEDGKQIGEFELRLSNEILKLNGDFSVTHIPKLYQRIDRNAEIAKIKMQLQSEDDDSKSSQPKQNGKLTKMTPENKSEITIGDFSKVHLVTASVIKAEVVEGSEKLLRLEVQTGPDTFKQIFSGIRKDIRLEEIVNRKVLIVANLAPRKMKFGVSEGMLLTAEDANGRALPVFLSDDLPDGVKLE